MGYILDGTTIRSPHSFKESNNTQTAVQRALSGAINRDIFGSNKRVWELEYNNVNSTDFTTIKAIYDSYLSTNTVKTWEVTETNYTIGSIDVHVDLLERDFSVKGSDYLSSFTLIRNEA